MTSLIIAMFIRFASSTSHFSSVCPVYRGDRASMKIGYRGSIRSTDRGDGLSARRERLALEGGIAAAVEGHQVGRAVPVASATTAMMPMRRGPVVLLGCNTPPRARGGEPRFRSGPAQLIPQQLLVRCRDRPGRSQWHGAAWIRDQVSCVPPRRPLPRPRLPAARGRGARPGRGRGSGRGRRSSCPAPR